MVQHLPVPLLQSLRLWDFLVGRMAVENVVVPFARRTCPDVSLGVPEGGKHRTTSTSSAATNWIHWQSSSAFRNRDRAAGQDVPEFLDIFKIADEDLVVHRRPQDPRSEEVNTIKVWYVDPSAQEKRGNMVSFVSREHVRSLYFITVPECTDLVFGNGHSEPYSCTCMPKKHTSTPSISSKAKSALVL